MSFLLMFSYTNFCLYENRFIFRGDTTFLCKLLACILGWNYCLNTRACFVKNLLVPYDGEYRLGRCSIIGIWWNGSGVWVADDDIMINDWRTMPGDCLAVLFEFVMVSNCLMLFPILDMILPWIDFYLVVSGFYICCSTSMPRILNPFLSTCATACVSRQRLFSLSDHIIFSFW